MYFAAAGLLEALLHGRERTVAEYERLLAAAGFRLVRSVPTRSPAGLGVIEAAPIARPQRGDSGGR